MDYNTIKTYFKTEHSSGDKCKAVCPAHDDKQASLSITYNKAKGCTGIKCFAGCATEDIVTAVGLKMSDLFDEGLEKSSSDDKVKSKIEAVYDYKDENGNVLFQKVRFKPKRFSQKRILQGFTVWGLDAGLYYETFTGSNEYSKKEREGAKTKEVEGLTPILYNLPRLVKASKIGETVFIVEGEKDVNNLDRLGLAATCNFDGASADNKKPKWREEYNHYFKGINVMLIPDNDNAGRAHATYIAESLNHIANSIRILELPELEEKGDVSDWLAQGHTREELIEQVKASENWEVYVRRWSKSVLKFNLSDVGNAERLTHMYGDNIRFNTTRNKWLAWNGKYWQLDDLGRVERLSKHVIRKLQQEGFSIDETASEENGKFKKQILGFVLKSENDSRIKAMINQAKSQVGVSIHEATTDKDIYLLNLKNGTLNLKTGKLYNHNRKDFITKVINVDHKENQTCPNWLSFLDKIFLGDKEIIEYMQKVIGYSLTGSTAEQCFFMLYGNGANGKSTFLNTIQTILGDYSDSLKGSSLMVKRNDDGPRGDLAKLKSKRFVIASELNEGQTFDESLLKALTGGEDKVPVRFLYGEEFQLEPQFKLWIGTNEKPKVKGTNDGIWRRVRLIPFLYKFKDDEKDTKFFEKFLEPELPGILNWAIEGCLKWLSDGMNTPAKVTAAIDEYKSEMDVIQRFVDDCCVVAEGTTSRVNALYDTYAEWCKDNNEFELSSIKFSKKIKEKNFEQGKSEYFRYWKGIGIALEHEMTEVKDNVYPFQTRMGN